MADAPSSYRLWWYKVPGELRGRCCCHDLPLNECPMLQRSGTFLWVRVDPPVAVDG